MFIVRVHSVDSRHPLALAPSEHTDATNATPSNPNRNCTEHRGVVHLFRDVSRDSATTSLPNPSSRSTLLFIVAVPNYLSSQDFIRFCGSYIDHISELNIIRNDGMEDRYSVLIKLVNQLKADGFYRNFNGKRFSPAESEVCHILFAVSVEYTESAEIAGTPPVGYTELPTCPVCLERLDPELSGILSTLCDHSFQCSCISKWTHLSCQVCRFSQQQDERPTCFVCGTSEKLLWVCVLCGFVGCGRYKEGHAIRHWKDTQHCYSLDLETQRVWDYVGDNYVHRLNQSEADCKLEMMSSPCMSHEGDCGTCGCSEDSGISEALFSSKFEAIVDEYNHLLATQLETQRQVETEQQLVEKGVGAACEGVHVGDETLIRGLPPSTPTAKRTDDSHTQLLQTTQIMHDSCSNSEGERPSSRCQATFPEVSSTEAPVFDVESIITNARRQAALMIGEDIKDRALKASVKELPLLVEKFEELFTAIRGLEVDPSPLKSQVEKLFTNVTRYNSVCYIYSGKMTSEARNQRLADVKLHLESALTLEKTTLDHNRALKANLTSAEFKREYLKRELEDLEVEIEQHHSSIEQNEAQLSQMKDNVSRMKEEQASIANALVLTDVDTQILRTLHDIFENQRKYLKDLMWI